MFFLNRKKESQLSPLRPNITFPQSTAIITSHSTLIPLVYLASAPDSSSRLLKYSSTCSCLRLFPTCCSLEQVQFPPSYPHDFLTSVRSLCKSPSQWGLPGPIIDCSPFSNTSSLTFDQALTCYSIFALFIDWKNRLHKGREFCLFCSLLHPQKPELGWAHSMHSVTICWVNE